MKVLVKIKVELEVPLILDEAVDDIPSLIGLTGQAKIRSDAARVAMEKFGAVERRFDNVGIKVAKIEDLSVEIL